MEKPTFKEALKFWTKLGFISFGGENLWFCHSDSGGIT